MIGTAEAGGVGQQERVFAGFRSGEAEPGIGMLEEISGQHAFVIVIEGRDLAVGQVGLVRVENPGFAWD